MQTQQLVLAAPAVEEPPAAAAMLVAAGLLAAAAVAGALFAMGLAAGEPETRAWPAPTVLEERVPAEVHTQATVAAEIWARRPAPAEVCRKPPVRVHRQARPPAREWAKGPAAPHILAQPARESAAASAWSGPEAGPARAHTRSARAAAAQSSPEPAALAMQVAAQMESARVAAAAPALPCRCEQGGSHSYREPPTRPPRAATRCPGAWRPPSPDRSRSGVCCPESPWELYRPPQGRLFGPYAECDLGPIRAW